VYRTLSRSLQRIRKKLIDYGPSHFPPSRSAQPNGPRADEDERLSESKNAAAISFPFTVETVENRDGLPDAFCFVELTTTNSLALLIGSASADAQRFAIEERQQIIESR
jgi:hypothetical protein